MRNALRVLPFLLFGFLLAGCKPEAPYQTGGVLLPKPARKIVSLAPGATEVLAAKGGAYNWLVGRTESDDYPKIVQRIPIVAAPKPNWERIAHQKPDLIVYDPDLVSPSDVTEMAKYSRMPPFPLGGNTIDEFIKNLMTVSTMYTGETFMSEYVDNIRAARDKALADPVKPTPTVAIIMPDKSGEHYIAGKNSFYADEVRAASGNPVGPAVTNFVPINAESLIEMNPDIIVTAGPSDPFVNDSRFKTLSAIKNKRVLQVPQDAMLRRGSRVPDVIEGLHNNFAGLMR